MGSDNLSTILYGKIAKVKLADGNEYTLREPNIDTLENLGFEANDINDIKNIKKLAWILLENDNPSLNKERFGKLITLSMMTEGSDFMKAILTVLGRDVDSKKE